MLRTEIRVAAGMVTYAGISIVASSTTRANLSSAIISLFDDQPVTALCTEVCPDPLEEDAEPQAILSQKLHVDQSPHEPSEETTHPDTPALQYGKILADYGKVALVEVAKGRKR